MAEYDFLWWIGMVGVGHAAFVMGVAGTSCGLIISYMMIANT